MNNKSIEPRLPSTLIKHKGIVNMFGECKENRIYIRVEFTRKKCKTAILLYCFNNSKFLLWGWIRFQNYFFKLFNNDDIKCKKSSTINY